MDGVIGEQSVQLQQMQELLLEVEQLVVCALGSSMLSNNISVDEHKAQSAWSKVIGMLVHEIRNPLVPIGGFAQRLYRSFPEEDKRKEESLIIVKEVKRLENILNSLLRYK